MNIALVLANPCHVTVNSCDIVWFSKKLTLSVLHRWAGTVDTELLNSAYRELFAFPSDTDSGKQW